MKELSIEEKAKRYDELKVTAQGLEQDGCFDKLTLFDLFPELKESEDERIRKELITFFQRFPYERIGNDCTKVKEAIAWLEKQGEQKPAWTEEDEEIFSNVIMDNNVRRGACIITQEYHDKVEGWLKSLKERVQPQSTWKPSDEHIHWLKWAINKMPDNEKANEAEAVLEELLEQLKKLKGE